MAHKNIHSTSDGELDLYSGFDSEPDCPGEIGDILCFDRGVLYDHYAVKTGFQEVVHITGGGDAWSALSASGGSSVRSSLGGGIVQVQPYSEAKAATGSDRVTVIKSGARTDEERLKIVVDAKRRIGKWDYHILFGNCEHFARKVVFNIWESKQSKGAAKKIALIPGVNLLGLAYFFFAKFCDCVIAKRR